MKVCRKMVAEKCVRCREGSEGRERIRGESEER